MRRSDILSRMGIDVPETSIKNVIIDTDARNEADDQYAIMHHLLSPSVNVLGIIAAHFEGKDNSGISMEKSFDEIKKVLALAQIDDVKTFKGQRNPMDDEISDGVAFIIDSAKKNNHTYVCCMGALTNISKAISISPEITSKITVIVNGGGPYPLGRPEFNFMQDIKAAQFLFESNADIWQIHQDVYSSLEVSIAELRHKVYPNGKIGRYLYENLIEENKKEYNPYFLLRTGENWTLGDNTTIGVLLMNNFRGQSHEEHAPIINDSGMYIPNPSGRIIKVFDYLDARLIIDDFFSKLALAYDK